MTIVAIVLGLVAMVSSLLLLVLCMNANVLRPGQAFGHLFGSSRDYVSWCVARSSGSGAEALVEVARPSAACSSGRACVCLLPNPPAGLS